MKIENTIIKILQNNKSPGDHKTTVASSVPGIFIDHLQPVVSSGAYSIQWCTVVEVPDVLLMR